MSANNFIIFFTGKEGTSPIVRLLNNFDQLSIVHQVDGKGWEPFDRHNCGPMPINSLKECFDHIYKDQPINMNDLNYVYTQTAKKPLDEINSAKTIGLKMRFTSPRQAVPKIARLPIVRKVINLVSNSHRQHVFNEHMIKLLKKYQIVPFMAVRQDVFRWGLSKYHGDGTGKQGHLQFKIANGTLKTEDLPKINIDCGRLEKIIINCERVLQKKRNLFNMLEKENIKVYPLLYEKFCSDKLVFFAEMFSIINLSVSRDDIESAVEKGSYFKKVHSDNISSFVENHEEVIEKFGHRFVEWG